jgi:spermidine/putrescine transport system permease protein
MTTSSTIVGQAEIRPRLSRDVIGAFLGSDTVRAYGLISPLILVIGLLLCAPIVFTVAASFWTQHNLELERSWTLANYVQAWTSPVYRTLFLRSLWISGSVTVLTVLLAYPIAYYVAFYVHGNKLTWILILTIPFWTSYLLRVFAWKLILGYNGAINSGLQSLGLISEPLEFLLYNPIAIVITLTHAWMPFAILPIYVSLEKLDRSLIEAATDLGDGPVARFLRVTLPLSMPGVTAAALMIFIPTVGDYITPLLVGGPDGLMIANAIGNLFGRSNNWPLGSALSVSSIAIVAALSLVYLWATRRGFEKVA